MALAVCFLSGRPNSPLLQISDFEGRKEGKILFLQSIVFPLHHQTWLSSWTLDKTIIYPGPRKIETLHSHRLNYSMRWILIVRIIKLTSYNWMECCWQKNVLWVVNARILSYHWSINIDQHLLHCSSVVTWDHRHLSLEQTMLWSVTRKYFSSFVTITNQFRSDKLTNYLNIFTFRETLWLMPHWALSH